MTSHDVIGFLRRVLNTKKIGDSGTLDPDAAGVLPVFAGSATRLLEYAAEDRKSYRAEITFGVKTDTGGRQRNGYRTQQPACMQQRRFSALLAEFTGRQKTAAANVFGLKT